MGYLTQGQTISSGERRTWGSSCPAGTKVVGGGASTEDPTDMVTNESAPANDGTGWVVTVENVSTSTIVAYAWAICVGA